MLRNLRHLLLLVGVVLLLPVSAAQADVIQDCSQDDVLNRGYSKSELQRALNNIPGDVDEYTLCRSLINRALSGDDPKAGAAGSDGDGSGGSGGDGSSGGRDGSGNGKNGDARSGSHQQLASVDEILDSAGSDRAGTASTASGMPVPALLALIALACLAIAGGIYLLAKRNPAFANALRRVPLPKRRS